MNENLTILNTCFRFTKKKKQRTNEVLIYYAVSITTKTYTKITSAHISKIPELLTRTNHKNQIVTVNSVSVFLSNQHLRGTL